MNLIIPPVIEVLWIMQHVLTLTRTALEKIEFRIADLYEDD